MRGPLAGSRTVHRSASASVIFIGSAVIAVLLLGDALLRGGASTMLLLAPWVLLVLWGVYVVVFASAVTTDANAIAAQNYLRRARVPWGAVEDIELRYQLVITTHDGDRVACFGGPASGRPGRLSRSVGADEERRVPAAARDLDRIRGAWDDARGRGAAGGAITRSWDLPAVAALLVLAAAAVVATLVTAV